MGIRIGNVPTSILNDTDNILFAEGEAPRKAQYSEMKADIIGSAALLTSADKPKEAINELVQDLLDSVGYGVISGGVVSAQSTPNMTVQVTACTYKTSTGARKTATANSSLTVAAADTTNPRIDAIYINSSGIISYLQGTAAASPVAPTTPVGGFLLTQINVLANVTSITNSNIVDMRKMLISTDYLNTQLSEITNNKRAQYSISSYLATQTGTWFNIPWDKKIFDTNGFIDQASNTTITIKESGLYIINVAISFIVNASGTRNIKITKNNNEVIGYDSRNAWAANDTRCNLSIIQYFNINETVVVSTYQDSGVSVKLKVEQGAPLISIAKIGGAV